MLQLQCSEHDAFDLFRQAIVGRSDEAWASIYEQYRLLMIGWAHGYRPNPCFGESVEDIADRAFERAWHALTPQRFERFAGVGALLAYLRSCVLAVVIDEARSFATRDRAHRHLRFAPVETPENLVMSAAARVELWAIIRGLLSGMAEHVLMEETFILGLKPQAIQQRHPDLFASVDDLYALKRNLVARLERCPAVREWFGR
ncbi:MAG TPA: hypothetical protein PLO33_13700 [Kouleothrix sp.]|mgnify:CR=1 FL=1|uniref:RNA polymerase sigma factor n=1 Tax=Kouleothrix sp. TaxID=2779161 RepID=UPI002BFD9975|nr:hypothetical protein [Kouleothrix sp.]HRC76725.1 hypothetical protein [Kouleothrix sp.]